MYRFFKCNVLGGFRLSDLNKSIKQGEYFFIDSMFCETSRATKVALESKWMTEVTEKEASQFIEIPKQAKKIVDQVSEIKQTSASKLAIPDVKEVNSKIESRQASRAFKSPMQKQKPEEKPIVPNFNEAERAMRKRQNDVTTKGEDEVIQSPIEIKKEKVKISVQKDEVIKDLVKDISADNTLLSVPDFNEKKEEVKAEIKEQIKNKSRRRKKSEDTK